MKYEVYRSDSSTTSPPAKVYEWWFRTSADGSLIDVFVREKGTGSWTLVGWFGTGGVSEAGFRRARVAPGLDVPFALDNDRMIKVTR